MFWIYGFTLKILERGDLLPIPMTLNSNIFLPTLVNNDQDFMCLQNKPNFKYKLHPIKESLLLKTVYLPVRQNVSWLIQSSVTTLTPP